MGSVFQWHKVAIWIKEKQNPATCCLQETHFNFKNSHRLKEKEWKKIFDANGN